MGVINLRGRFVWRELLQPVYNPLTPSGPIISTWWDWGGICDSAANAGSPARWRSTRGRWIRSTMHSPQMSKSWHGRDGSSKRSRVIQGSGPWVSTERCSTCPTISRPSVSLRWRAELRRFDRSRAPPFRISFSARPPMDFSLTDEQVTIRSAVEEICVDFDDDYWLKKDRHGGFPEDFYLAMATAGWLGVAMPQEYGGGGPGLSQRCCMLVAGGAEGACPARGCSRPMHV